jgi:phage tail-like protein
MPRVMLEDFYQNHRFHLIDVTQATSLTGGAFIAPFLVLSPQIGFQAIQLPRMSMNVVEFSPGNAPFAKAVAGKGSIENMTLTRGVYIGDKEFYDWMVSSIYGRGAYKRNLLLFQYSNEPGGDSNAERYLRVMGAVSAALALEDTSPVVSAVAAKGIGLTGLNVYARVWKLDDVFPVGYSPATGFDASDDGITVAELELHVGSMVELTLGTPPITRGV